MYCRGDVNINQHVCKALIVEKYENNEGGYNTKRKKFRTYDIYNFT